MRIKIRSLLALFLFSSLSYAEETPSLTQTNHQLKQLDNKINALKRNLVSAKGKRSTLNLELAGTEKEIGQSILKLYITTSKMQTNQQRIKQIQSQIKNMELTLTKEQQKLAQHIALKYKMSEYQPVKWLINQQDLVRLNKSLTFYQYLIKANQQSILTVKKAKMDLKQEQQALNRELEKQFSLQQTLYKYQQKLEKNKLYHKAILQSLDNSIENQQKSLSEFEENKANLSKLVKNLVKQSVTYPSQFFNNMLHKLPKPVRAENTKKMHQGITFFAGEGTPVHAVYPGKVVFSDWLNGYGLLLILDHGKGFMTLYAHNQTLFKSKGSIVVQGDQIAAVGHSGGIKQNGLYFEIRKHGKAITPWDWFA